MPWFKIDDTLAHHPKVVAAGNAALGLWLRAGAYCAQQLTDGFVPDDIVKVLGTRSQASRLVAAGLWEHAAGGFRFHDWTEYQPARSDVLAERAANKKRQARWREQRRGNAVTNGVTNAGTNAGTNGGSNAVSNSLPDPTRPDPTYNPRARGGDDVTGDRQGARAGGTQPTFDDFWKAYPKQVAEKLAKAAWGRATVDADPADILAGLHAQLPTLRAVSDPKFIPNPSTWLNDGRWTDRPPVEDDPWRDLPRIGGDS